MRLSNLNIKKINLNEVSDKYSGEDILLKLGELYQFESGIYAYGNLWTKLERFVEEVIIDELDKAGCIQVEFPKLQPKKIWQQSNRWDLYTKDNDIMFTIDTNLGEYGMAPTAEECATIFAANRLISHKNLPATYYQIGEKFRKEKRARGYLFRPRTFVMLDAYSFHKNEEDMKKTYDIMHEVYLKIFNRLGIKIIPTVSDNGVIGGSVAEEFQVITPLGEDTIYYDEKRDIGINSEVLSFDNKDEYLKQLGTSIDSLKEYTSVELGNNFQLGTKYSENMKVYFKDEEGKDRPYYMGCYGMGLGRIIACLIENNLVYEDDKLKGFVLPLNVAPYKVQIIYKEDKEKEAESLYSYLQDNNIKCVLDDREGRSIGTKLKDVYVLGTPYSVIIGDKTEGNVFEVEDNKTTEKYNITKEELLEMLTK